MDRPGKVANPARGQLNGQTNVFILFYSPPFPFAPGNFVSRDWFRRPAGIFTNCRAH